MSLKRIFLLIDFFHPRILSNGSGTAFDNGKFL